MGSWSISNLQEINVEYQCTLWGNFTIPDLGREGHALEVMEKTGIFPKGGMQTWY